MSFLKYIMSPFVEFKPEEEQIPANEKSDRAAVQASIPPASQPLNLPSQDPVMHMPTSPAGVANTGLASSEHSKYFEALIEDANAKNPLFTGTDFKEFVDSKIEVESIQDEGLKYQTTFNILKKTGLTKERLISTGQKYARLVADDIKNFENAYAQQYKKDVEDKELLLQSKAAEIKSLNEKITSMNQEMQQISQQIDTNKQQLDSRKHSFVSAGELKLKEIESELQKISQYF